MVCLRRVGSSVWIGEEIPGLGTLKIELVHFPDKSFGRYEQKKSQR